MPRAGGRQGQAQVQPGLLQQSGNQIRFQKSIAQLIAKAKWVEMGEEAKAPYEAKHEAEVVRYREWKEAEAAGNEPAAGGGGATPQRRTSCGATTRATVGRQDFDARGPR